MTVVALMTVICGGFLDAGVHLPFVGSSAVCLASSPSQYPYIEVGMVMIGLRGRLPSMNLGRVPPRSSRAYASRPLPLVKDGSYVPPGGGTLLLTRRPATLVRVLPGCTAGLPGRQWGARYAPVPLPPPGTLAPLLTSARRG
jgi:hypothetical protein